LETRKLSCFRVIHGETPNRAEDTPRTKISLVILISNSACSQKINLSTPVEVDVALLQHQVPNHSEWIGTTVGYIDARIHYKVTSYLLAQDYRKAL
jgi:hypothetical protein